MEKNKVLITVIGGVADYHWWGDVEVLLIDYDNAAEDEVYLRGITEEAKEFIPAGETKEKILDDLETL